MTFRTLTALAAAVTVLAACSFQNPYEKEAQRITDAVMANDLSPIENDISPKVHITRVQVAQWSDELNQQGKLISIKETDNCPAGAHCFNAKFEKHDYLEYLKLDENGKIYDWRFKMAPAAAGS